MVFWIRLIVRIARVIGAILAVIKNGALGFRAISVWFFNVTIRATAARCNVTIHRTISNTVIWWSTAIGALKRSRTMQATVEALAP
jgi:hypothetical protein